MLRLAILRPSARTVHSFVKQRTCRYSAMPLSSHSSQRSSPRARLQRVSAKASTRPIILAENKCVNVLTWDILRGPAEALTLIRAVEKKYGPVESFVLKKDTDHPDLYQTQVRITFRDLESFLRVPERTETIHLRGPKVQARRPGGVGLDEILPLISEDPEFLTADQISELSPEERSIDFRIQRSNNALLKVSPYNPLYPDMPSRAGRQLLEWGGFYEMKPIDSKRLITNQELTDETLDHVHMRVALRDWASNLKVRNPYEVYPDEPAKVDAEESVSQSGLDEKKVTAEDPLAMLDDLSALDISKSKSERDPFKELLGMEDMDFTETEAELLRATDATTSDPQPVSATSTFYDSVSQSRELQHAQGPSLTPPSATQQPPHPDTPTLTSKVEAQEQRPKQPKREVNEARGAQMGAQLTEAKRLADLAKPTGKPKSTKVKAKNKARKQKATPTGRAAGKQDAEPKTSLGKLFSKIQDIFKRS